MKISNEKIIDVKQKNKNKVFKMILQNYILFIMVKLATYIQTILDTHWYHSFNSFIFSVFLIIFWIIFGLSLATGKIYKQGFQNCHMTQLKLSGSGKNVTNEMIW